MAWSDALSAYQTPNRQVIWLKGDQDHYDEDPTVGATYPGYVLDIFNNAGVRSVRTQSTPGADAAIAIALEDSLQGLTINDVYPDTSLVRYAIAKPGDEFQVRIPIGALVTKADLLCFDGLGHLIKAPFSTGTLLYDAVAPSTAITNTTVETPFSTTYNIPANTLKVGDVIRVKAQGIASAVASGTLTFKLYIGTNVIVTTGAVAVAAGDEGYFEADIVIRSIGATGTFVATGIQALGTPGTVTEKPYLLASTAIDTTVAEQIKVTATWSIANAGNSTRLDILEVNRVAGTGAGQKPVAMATVTVDNTAGSAEVFVDVMAI